MTTQTPARSRRTLFLILAVCVAPVIASYTAYYLLPRDSRTNYGELLATGPAPAISGTTLAGATPAGKPFALADVHGEWAMIVGAGGACDETCVAQLYATRQARTIQGRERERVVRLWLVTDDVAPPGEVLIQHPDITVVRAALGPSWPAGPRAIYLVDPLGNQVLAWPVAPDIKAMARDLTRLLKASQIG